MGHLYVGDAVTERNLRVHTKDLASAQWIADFVGCTVQNVNYLRRTGLIETVEWKGNGRPLYYWPHVRKVLIATEHLSPEGHPWKKVAAP